MVILLRYVFRRALELCEHFPTTPEFCVPTVYVSLPTFFDDVQVLRTLTKTYD